MTISSGTYPGRRCSRRDFVKSTVFLVAGGMTGAAIAANAQGQANPGRKVLVGAHPWVYAATQPEYDITPVLPTIFADMEYARFEGIELMHTALRPADAVERIGELSRQHKLPVIGTSFSGAMWDRARH